MVREQSRCWVLARRPTGIVGREHLDWREQPVPSITDGEFLVRNLWLSCDPAQRGWMEMDSYVPMLPLGEVMASGAAGEVSSPSTLTSRRVICCRECSVGRTTR